MEGKPWFVKVKKQNDDEKQQKAAAKVENKK